MEQALRVLRVLRVKQEVLVLRDLPDLRVSQSAQVQPDLRVSQAAQVRPAQQA